jgi:hypothetical protein
MFISCECGLISRLIFVDDCEKEKEEEEEANRCLLFCAHSEKSEFETHASRGF